MDVTQAAIAQAKNNPEKWKSHPSRESQKVYELRAQKDLYWKGCEVLESGVLVQWKKDNGEQEHVLFVTTKLGQTAKQILANYDQRTEIEESHRQMKCFQGLEKLPSKKYPQVVFRIIMAVIGYNLMNLFLNSEHCETFEKYSLKTMQQKRKEEKNPEVIIYTKTTFAIMRQFELFSLLLLLKTKARKRLAELFKNLSLPPAPT